MGNEAFDIESLLTKHQTEWRKWMLVPDLLLKAKKTLNFEYSELKSIETIDDHDLEVGKVRL